MAKGSDFREISATTFAAAQRKLRKGEQVVIATQLHDNVAEGGWHTPTDERTFAQWKNGGHKVYAWRGR